VEHRACWVVDGCGREPGGTRVAETGPCVVATDPRQGACVCRTRSVRPWSAATETLCGRLVRQLIEEAL